MKKVKTILTSILLLLASAFITACSCSEEADITHIYAQKMTIECVGEADKFNPRDEGGTLTLDANVGDVFQIRYSLTPVDTTDTKVTWDVSDKTYLAPENESVWSYTKSISEDVSFRVKNYSTTDATKNRITLTFRAIKGAKDLYYEERVIVNIYPRAENKPTLSAPVGLKYDGAKGEISWDPITTVITSTGETILADRENGAAKGLLGYTLKITNYETNETKDVTIGNRTQVKYNIHELKDDNNKEFIVPGKTYGFSVLASADGRNAVMGDRSAEFKFHQIPIPEIVDTDDRHVSSGVIPVKNASYNTANNALTMKTIVSYGKFNNEIQKKEFDTTSGIFNVDVKTFFNYDNFNQFNISMATYPSGYFENSDNNGRRYQDLGYIIGETTGGIKNVHIYPSLECKMLYDTENQKVVTGTATSATLLELPIEKFEVPSIEILNREGTCAIDWKVSGNNKHTEFEDSALSSVLHFSNTRTPAYNAYQTQYLVEIFNDSQVKVYSQRIAGESVELNSLPLDKNGGNYIVKVSRVGNERLVIGSAVKEFSFYYLGALGAIDGQWYIENGNTLAIADSFAISGVELYFLDQSYGIYGDTTDDSTKIRLGLTSNYETSLDLSLAGLPAGTYQVFGRYLGIYDDDDNNNIVCTATGGILTEESFNSPLFTFTVTAPIADNYVESSGNIMWRPVEGVEYYDIILGYRRDKNEELKKIATIRVSVRDAVDDYLHAHAVSVTNSETHVTTITNYYINISELVDLLVTTPDEPAGSIIDKALGLQGIAPVMMLNSNAQFNYSIIAKGADAVGNIPMRVDSIATRSVKFGMVEPTGNKLLANATFNKSETGSALEPDAYVLSFEVPESYSENQRIMLGLRIEEKQDGEVISSVTYWTGSLPLSDYRDAIDENIRKIALNNEQLILGNNNYAYFHRMIPRDSERYNVAIIVKTIGTRGQATQVGWLDNETFTYFNAVSETPDTLAVTNEGILTWNTTATATTDAPSADVKYLVRFYVEDDNVPANLVEDVTLRRIVSQSEDGGEYSYSLDVGSAISSKYTGKNVTIKVQEIVDSATFTGPESAGLVVVKLATPVVTRVATDKTFTWTAIPGATGYRYCIMGENEPVIGETTNTTFTIDAVMTPGEYTFTVVAMSDVAGVVYSEASSATSGAFVVLSGEITCVVNETSLVWSSIATGTSYTVKYWIEDDPEHGIDHPWIEELGVDVTELNVDQLFENGQTYKVQITPHVNWLNGAYAIESAISLSSQSITRTEGLGVGAIDTHDGVLVVTAPSTQEYTLQLYEYNAGAYDPIIIDAENDIVHEDDSSVYTIYLRNITPGAHTIHIRLAQENLVTSRLSNGANITKIGQVVVTGNDSEKLIKDGEYLYWNPVEYANMYLIKSMNGDTLVGQTNVMVRYDGTTYVAYDYCDLTTMTFLSVNQTSYFDTDTETLRVPVPGVDDDLGEHEIIIYNIVDYVNGRIKFYFDEDIFIDDCTGVFTISITPTVIDDLNIAYPSLKLINGQPATMDNTITKLNANLTAGVENGRVVFYTMANDPETNESVKVYNYVADTTESGEAASPVAIYYEIRRYTIEEVQPEDPEADPVSTRVYDDNNTITGVYSNSATWTSLNVTNVNTIDGDLVAISLNTNGSDLDVGMYEVRWVVAGDGNYILAASGNPIGALILGGVNRYNTLNDPVEKLETVVINTYQGEISWSSANELNNNNVYIVNITSSDESENYTIYVPATNVDSEEIEGEQEGDPSTYRFTLTEDKLVYMDENEDEQLFVFEPNKLYTIKVMVTATGKINSQWSQNFNVKKLLAPTNTRITLLDWDTNDTNSMNVVPVVLYTNSNTVATPLKLQVLYGTDSLRPALGFDRSNASYKMKLDTTLDLGNTTIKLRYLGNTTVGTNNVGLLTSSFTQGEDLTYVADVASVVVNNGMISWEEVDGAYSYRVTVYTKAQYSAYISYLSGGAKPVAKLEKYTTGTTYDLTADGIATSLNESGGYFIVINAITNPQAAIVSTSPTLVAEYTNTTNFFKPLTVTNYKVIDGMLSWTIAKSEIQAFVDAVGEMIDGETPRFEFPEEIDADTTVGKIMNFVHNHINLDVGDSKLESQLAHLLRFRMIVNGEEVVDCAPDGVELLDSNGLVVAANSFNANAIRYYYNVGVDPEVESVDENEVGAHAGFYNIQVGTQGNSDNTAPVINSTYSTSLQAYKPLTPKTWLSDGADIRKGSVQWGLVATTFNDVTQNWNYYHNYRITAIAQEGDDRAVKLVDIADTVIDPLLDPALADNNTNLTGDYTYKRAILGDLFTMSGNAGNVLRYNTMYSIWINTVGTADSDLLGANETIYLNSNYCSYEEDVDVLQVSQGVAVRDSKLTWETAYGSTSTKVFIYGPFDYLLNQNGSDYYIDGENKVIFKDGRDDESEINAKYNLTEIYNAYFTEANNLNNELIEKAKLLHIVDFPVDETGERSTEYTISDLINRGENVYGAGGYVIRLQEMGNDRGIIDSVISQNYIANKLDMMTQVTNGIWLNANGQFAWNAVPYANRYKVVYCSVPVEVGEDEEPTVQELSEEIVSTTYYEPQSGTRFNQDGYNYYITVYAYRYTTSGGTEAPEDWFFYGDHRDTIAYPRLFIPADLTIYNNGRITWNNATDYDKIRGYMVQFNWIVEEVLDSTSDREIFELRTESNVSKYNAAHGDQAGSIRIRVKALPSMPDYKYIVSSYTDAMDVTRLSDPYARLVNGVFSWGLVSTDGNETIDVDPITNSLLYINDSADPIEIVHTIHATGESGEETGEIIKIPANYPLFTRPEDLDDLYDYSDEMNTYPTGEYTFRVQFEGSGGPVGTALNNTDAFYIASNEKGLTATKLHAPNVLQENSTSEFANHDTNFIYWAPVNHACGYRVYVVSTDQEGNVTTTTEEIFAELLAEVRLGQIPEGCNFYYLPGATEYIGFRLDDSISNTVQENGGVVKVYVQTIGSMDTPTFNAQGQQTNTLYLSSSYSNAKVFETPPKVQAIRFNESTGVFSWTWNEERDEYEDYYVSSDYDIRIAMNYRVSAVTTAEMAYWIDSADSITGANAVGGGNHPYPSIAKRTVNATETSAGSGIYNLQVEDIVILFHDDLGNTYTSSFSNDILWYNYTLTSVGSNYTFTIYAFAGGYSSDHYTNNVSYHFMPFTSGDGSENNPYHVDSYAQLNNVRLFPDRDYLITSDIDFKRDETQNYFRAIEAFSGNITGAELPDGNGGTRPVKFKNVAYAIVTYGTGVNTQPVSAFIYENTGNITGIDFEMNHTITSSNSSYPGFEIYVATVAALNYGEISNINIKGADVGVGMIVNPGAGRIVLGGVVAINHANIMNVTVKDIVITAMDNNSSATYAGGIVAYMESGIIQDVTFDGSIRSNFVAGIATEVRDGMIDRAVVGGNAVITTTDKSGSGSFKSIAPSVGGMVARATAGSGKTIIIENSYSQAHIVVEQHKKGNVNKAVFTVGGLAGYVNAVGSVVIDNIYIVLNITINQIDDGSANVFKDDVYVYNLFSQGSNAPTVGDVYYYVLSTSQEGTDNTNRQIVPQSGSTADFNLAWESTVMLITEAGENVFKWEKDQTNTYYLTPYPVLNDIV